MIIIIILAWLTVNDNILWWSKMDASHPVRKIHIQFHIRWHEKWSRIKWHNSNRSRMRYSPFSLSVCSIFYSPLWHCRRSLTILLVFPVSWVLVWFSSSGEEGQSAKRQAPRIKDPGSNHWWHPLPTIEFNTFLLRRQFVAGILASGLAVRVDILLAAISWWLWFVCHFPFSIFHFPL